MIRGFNARVKEKRRKAREARIQAERDLRNLRRRQESREWWWESDVDVDNL